LNEKNAVGGVLVQSLRHLLTEPCERRVYVGRRESVDVALKQCEKVEKAEFCLDFLQVIGNLPRDGHRGSFLTPSTNMGRN
jgi:hypothetical protein